MSIEAVIAANRFGLGARPGELTQIGADPRGWLKQQVRGSRTPPPVIAALPSSEKAFEAYTDAVRMRREARQDATAQGEPAKLVVQGIRRRLGPIHSQQVLARYQWASTTPESFRERLVHFWTNHFAVSAEKPQVLVLAGTLENEAVRPNLAGRFAEMLLAVESHPAMIFYLDNQASVGPNSKMAQRAARNPQRKLDINENLAREVLELHTLGVQGGYTQQDVTTFAKILTGWSVSAGRFAGNGKPGAFAFRPAAHEPGAKTLLGKRYAQEGEAQVRAVLDDLARHPATAEHLARKLVCHFIADEPPAAAVTRIAKVFRDSDGSLPEVHAALADLPEAWGSKSSKYKTPHEFVVSAFRATSFVPQRPQQAVGPLQLLGQAPYRPGSPAGWPDTASQWDGPDALLNRVEWAAQLGANSSAQRAPLELATQSLGEALSEHTRTAIARAANAAQGITLWLASPEFLRR